MSRPPRPVRLALVACLFAAAGCAAPAATHKAPVTISDALLADKPKTTAAPAPPLIDEPPPGADRRALNAAIEAMDEGRFDLCIPVLEELRARHPTNAVVLHELALAYRLSKQPQRAVEILDPVRDRLPMITVASLASALDEAGRSSEAAALLREAIVRFPRSGLLHSELATTLGRAGDVPAAIQLYEHGIEVDPAFPATYKNLATLFAKTRSRGLTLIHGETFRVLEPATARSREMAETMVRVAADAVVAGRVAGKLDCKIALAPDPPAGGPLPLANAFEAAFGPRLCEAHAKGLNLASLHDARRAFIDDLGKPNQPFDWASIPLFPWLRSLAAAGHLEAYDYWLYGPASPDEAGAWVKGHEQAMSAMVEWLVAHPLFVRPPEEGDSVLRADAPSPPVTGARGAEG